MILTYFTLSVLSNRRRFYSSMGSPLAVKGMASRYCQKPFEFLILVKLPFNICIGELQIFNGEIGKGMGEFSKAMVES